MDIKDYGFKLLDSLNDQNLQKEIDRTIKLLENIPPKSRVYTIGNGGSSTLAEHFSQDLTKSCKIPSIFLGNISTITAFANDLDFSKVFYSQLLVYISINDILICFSSSGNSKNIVEAVKFAKHVGVNTISFTGFSGGKVKEWSDINIHIPIDDYGIVESAHDLIMHYIIKRLNDN